MHVSINQHTLAVVQGLTWWSEIFPGSNPGTSYFRVKVKNGINLLIKDKASFRSLNKLYYCKNKSIKIKKITKNGEIKTALRNSKQKLKNTEEQIIKDSKKFSTG